MPYYYRCLFIFLFFNLLGIQLKITCAESDLFDPLAVYLTWQKSPERTMTIHWITHEPHPNQETIYYRKLNEMRWQKQAGGQQLLADLPAYLVHTVELTGLVPDTSYSFKIGPQGAIFKFRTMPAIFEETLRFVVGGDFYHDGLDSMIETHKVAAKSDPYFALVGGDIAYAADRFAGLADEMDSWMNWIKGKDDRLIKRFRWIEWLIAWKNHMVTPDGHLIPIIPALGNHDVNGGFGKTSAEASCFHTLFAMPGQNGYNVLDFGNYLSIFMLDSGHTNSVGGKQTQWLYESLNARQNVKHKFALYHVPAFPCYRKFNNPVSSDIRLYWVPLFEMFGLKAAFENHDHAYKRTHPLKNGRIDPTGVLYLGDGAWGIKRLRRPQSIKQMWYLAKTVSSRHFILVNISQKNCQFKAIDHTGKTIDIVNDGF